LLSPPISYSEGSNGSYQKLKIIWMD